MNELVQILKNTRQHLMTGVSHMIPFVAVSYTHLDVYKRQADSAAESSGAETPQWCEF